MTNIPWLTQPISDGRRAELVQEAQVVRLSSPARGRHPLVAAAADRVGALLIRSGERLRHDRAHRPASAA